MKRPVLGDLECLQDHPQWLRYVVTLCEKRGVADRDTSWSVLPECLGNFKERQGTLTSLIYDALNRLFPFCVWPKKPGTIKTPRRFFLREKWSPHTIATHPNSMPKSDWDCWSPKRNWCHPLPSERQLFVLLFYHRSISGRRRFKHPLPYDDSGIQTAGLRYCGGAWYSDRRAHVMHGSMETARNNRRCFAMTFAHASALDTV